MKLGDKVLGDDKIGIIVKKYVGAGFDWEVAFINNSPSGCWLDCYKEEHLTLYKWKQYPHTFWDKLKLLIGKYELLK